MSDTPTLADECKKLLDNGWEILLFRNQLGSYTARTRVQTYNRKRNPKKPTIYKVFETDDFEPSQALYRLAEKVYGKIA